VDEEASDETERDDGEESHDDELERPLTPLGLDREESHGDNAHDEAAPDQREAKEEVKRNRPADHLREIRRGGDEFRLDPEREPGHSPGAIADDLGKAPPRHEAQLRGEVLNQHRHAVGQDQYPHEQVPVTGPGSQVRGDVAGIDVGDCGDEGGAKEGDRRAAAGGARRAFTRCAFTRRAFPHRTLAHGAGLANRACLDGLAVRGEILVICQGHDPRRDLAQRRGVVLDDRNGAQETRDV
jgi:hypothetical protein